MMAFVGTLAGDRDKQFDNMTGNQSSFLLNK
jgi:hypothetical protein